MKSFRACPKTIFFNKIKSSSKVLSQVLGQVLIVIIISFLFQCSNTIEFRKTVPGVEINKFMGTWYVIASRATSFEEGAFNAIEKYSYNPKKDQIDIDFTFNKDSLTGEKKSLPQTGYIIDKINNSYWKVSPFWPLKFDYLIIALDKEYRWTVIGVPDQKYIWLMARTPKLDEKEYNQILSDVEKMGYNTKGMNRIINKE